MMKSYAGSCNETGPVVSSASKAVAEVEQGKLMGYIDRGIYIFCGIPYARAERFIMPEKVEPWNDLLDATSYGEICYQSSPSNNIVSPSSNKIPEDEFFNPHTNLPENENCQFLNINTPQINDDKKRPVMVWLHGGAFSAGSSVSPLTNGRNLSEKGDVVVVSLNHRLNVLGFLDLSAYGDKYKYSGNVGMADIVVALEWIKENIDEFGGDPDNITIFGQSGGGGKVLTLMATPAAEGLFDKAIVQSGAAFSFGMRLNNQKASCHIAELTLKNLNLSAKEVDKLQEVPYEDLCEAANEAVARVSEKQDIDYMWGPIKDGDYIPVHPAGKKFAAQSRNIPMMIGTVLNEFTTIIKNNVMDLLADNKNYWSREKVMSRLTKKYGDKAEEVLAAFKKAYPDKKPADVCFVDTMFRPGSLETARKKAAQNGAPVYSYIFTYEAPVMDGVGMAWHCAELPYVFNNIENGRVARVTGAGTGAEALAHMTSLAWINFAYNGEPNHEWIPEWPEFTCDKGATMIIDSVWDVRYNHDKELLNMISKQ